MSKIVMEETDMKKIMVGWKIWFDEERLGYTVIAKGGKFLILTKPFNPKKTVLYTIIDIEKMVRSTEDLIFGMGAETKEQCEQMLARLLSGQSSLSRRHQIDVNIRDIEEVHA